MKAPRSCHSCRRAKRKCIRAGLGESCNPCCRRNLACSLLSPRLRLKRADREPQSTGLEDESNSSLLPGLSHSNIVHLVELYLRHFHGGTHSIFHPNTLRSKVQSGSIGYGLLSAICALGSKFSSSSDRRALEIRLIGQAKWFVKADLENACLENIQTCLLLTLLSAGESQSSSETLFIRVAASMSEILNLESTADEGSIIAIETSRRVWWSLYLADRMCSSRLGLPRHMDYMDDYPPLPMSEFTFHSLSDDAALSLSHHKPGIFRYLMLLAQIFGKIHDFNWCVTKGNLNDTQLEQTAQSIGEQLETWKSNLPKDLQMTVENLHDHQQDEVGAYFITLHLIYHYYSILLYFYSLEKERTSDSGSTEDLSQCQAHASSFSSLLHLSRQMEGCNPHYPIISYMTTISSSVLLHTLLLGDVEQIPKARRDLNMNFEALLDLGQYWPATEDLIRKLIAFQNACIQAPMSSKLDGWMVRFLLQQSLGLKDSFYFEVDVSSDARITGIREEGRYTDFSAFNSS